MKSLKRVLPAFMGVVLCLSIFFGNVNTVYAKDKSIDSIFVSESSYEDSMTNKVVPYINKAKETGYMDVNEPNFKIYYEKYIVPDSKGTIVISHGFTESLEKYREMIYYFMNEGFSVYGLEHRGHGRSGHLGTKDSSEVNVNSFDDYVSDLKHFVDNIVRPQIGNQKLFLFAHSMGGGIATRYLEKYHNDFDAAILSAPMIEINTGNVPGPIASLISTVSDKDDYVMGQGPYSANYDFENSSTGCEARYAYYYNIVSNNSELQRGGASYRWLQTSLDATAKMILPCNAGSVTTPILLFQAGNDSYVKPLGQNIFKTFAKNCTMVKVSGSKHEIYREKDSILKPYLEKVMNFYNEHL